MKKKAEWFESFFGGLYGRVLGLAFDEKRTHQQALTVKRLLGLRKGLRVLDIPCGMGRLTIPLAQMGLAMTGVDLTAGYVRRARREAAKAGVQVRFIQGDMRRIEFDSQFDAAFNWFTSIGYFRDEEELDFCRRVLRALKPGGRFAVETLNKTWLLPRFIRLKRETVGDVAITHRNRWDAPSGRTVDTWTFRSGGKVERRRISLRPYSAPDLRKLLADAGFRDVRSYSAAAPGEPAYPLGPVTRHSRRIIVVGRRPV
jgi:ubiquinone/menaquinone biosynthesis C-methylase UbiE